MNAYFADGEQNSYFSKYGKDFQERIFQALLTDHTWASQMMEVMTAEYFEIKYLQYLSLKFQFDFYEPIYVILGYTPQRVHNTVHAP